MIPTVPLRPDRTRPTPSLAKAVALAVGVGGAAFLCISLLVHRELDTTEVGRPVAPLVARIALAELGAEPASHASSVLVPSATLADALDLAHQGRFTAAAARAAEISLPDLRAASLASVFALWAQSAPRTAAAVAVSLQDPAARAVAWPAVATIWAGSDPAGLAAFSWPLSDSALRNTALSAAIPRWLEGDEAAVLAWAGALPCIPESDLVLSFVARYQPLVTRDPELALSWAETIRDPVLRSRTLGDLVRAWLPEAPAAAARYARTSLDLFPSEREDILVGERFTEHP